MDAIMKQGSVKCECGNEYFYSSIYPKVVCMKCKKMNTNNGNIVVEDELTLEENESSEEPSEGRMMDGTNI